LKIKDKFATYQMLEHLFYYDIARCYAERFVLQVLYTTANKGLKYHIK